MSSLRKKVVDALLDDIQVAKCLYDSPDACVQGRHSAPRDAFIYLFITFLITLFFFYNYLFFFYYFCCLSAS